MKREQAAELKTEFEREEAERFYRKIKTLITCLEVAQRGIEDDEAQSAPALIRVIGQNMEIVDKLVSIKRRILYGDEPTNATELDLDGARSEIVERLARLRDAKRDRELSCEPDTKCAGGDAVAI